MSEDLFKVVLEGYKSGKGEFYIEQDLAGLFKISREKARELLLAAPKTIKENLSLEEATKYKDAIEKTGAACNIENMKFNLGGLSLEE